MALIYRSILEVASPAFLDQAPGLAAEWVKWKLGVDTLELAPGFSLEADDSKMEVHCLGGTEGEQRVYRVRVFEDRKDEGEEVRSTFTAMTDGTTSWSWMDVERWTTDALAPNWIPLTPSLVRTLLNRTICRRGPVLMLDTPTSYSRENVQDLIDLIASPERVTPIVVVTANQYEDGLSGARNRGKELSRRLGGIASVAILESGSVTPFSKSMLDLTGTPMMDVHSGASRSYMPQIGSERDHPRRHRLVPYSKIAGQPSELVARILTPTALARSAEMPPPPMWRDQIRSIIDAASGRSNKDTEDLIAFASDELKRAESQLETSQQERQKLAEWLEEASAENTELLGRIDDLQRRFTYLQIKLSEVDRDAAYAEPDDVPFRPDFCSEVIAEARLRLTLVEIPLSVDPGAEDLDSHCDPAWAPKAWAALQALNSYAVAKRDESYGGDFRTFCDTGRVPISSRVVAHHESESTRNTRRFRDLRTLSVSKDVDPSGEIYMESHIRIQFGGTPCPRIHFHDDTLGATGKIHIGWFGDHLDSRAKS